MSGIKILRGEFKEKLDVLMAPQIKACGVILYR